MALQPNDGPNGVRGAEIGDLLKLTVLEPVRRVPYGVISNRHSRGALVGECPTTPRTVALTAMEASLRPTIRFDVVAREDTVAAFGERVEDFR